MTVIELNCEYHFRYRANDDNWYNKHGGADSECVGENVIDPDNPGSTTGWDITDTPGFYNSYTVYYAVKY